MEKKNGDLYCSMWLLLLLLLLLFSVVVVVGGGVAVGVAVVAVAVVVVAVAIVVVVVNVTVTTTLAPRNHKGHIRDYCHPNILRPPAAAMPGVFCIVLQDNNNRLTLQ